MSETIIGRNEPCPCGSGKKYKRCCGVAAAPKLTAPNPEKMRMPAGMGTGGLDPAAMGMDQEWMMQFAQAMQRLPKGQLQRVQGLMQRAMAGKDVSKEASDFESSLPVEMQEMLRNFKMPANMAGAEGAEAPGGDMTEEQAKALVAKAAAEGKIDQTEAEKLLGEGGPQPQEQGKMGRFWKSISGKKQ